MELGLAPPARGAVTTRSEELLLLALLRCLLLLGRHLGHLPSHESDLTRHLRTGVAGGQKGVTPDWSERAIPRIPFEGCARPDRPVPQGCGTDLGRPPRRGGARWSLDERGAAARPHLS